MQKIGCKLTVLFEDPFWVCVYERIFQDTLEVCKITFGAEPRDYEVYAYFLENWSLLRFSPPVRISRIRERKISPKRVQRESRKQLDLHDIGTRSQQALKLQQEEGKTARKERTRRQKEDDELYKFELKQQKIREKHRGR